MWTPASAINAPDGQRTLIFQTAAGVGIDWRNDRVPHQPVWDTVAWQRNLPVINFPNWTPATPATGYYFPVRQHNDPVRDNEVLTFPAYQPVTQLHGSVARTPITVDQTVDSSTRWPIHRVTYYGDSHTTQI